MKTALWNCFWGNAICTNPRDITNPRGNIPAEDSYSISNIWVGSSITGIQYDSPVNICLRFILLSDYAGGRGGGRANLISFCLNLLLLC